MTFEKFANRKPKQKRVKSKKELRQEARLNNQKEQELYV